MGPKRFLSITVEWKKQSANKIHFNFESFSSTYSLGKKVKALFILAFSPAGGSFVSLIDLSSRPIGTSIEGSADKKSLKLI